MHRRAIFEHSMRIEAHRNSINPRRDILVLLRYSSSLSTVCGGFLLRVIYAVASFCCLTRAPSHPADAFLEFFFSGHPGLGPVLYIYHLTRIPSEMAGNFFRVRGMCGSMETYLQMRGAAFRPRVWRSALGGIVASSVRASCQCLVHRPNRSREAKVREARRTKSLAKVVAR